MRKIALGILLLVVCISAFAKQSKHKKKSLPANEIVSVSLFHSACYGRCPVYTIEVNKNGIATYTATLFNPDTGVFTKNIGVAKATEVINRFNAYRVDTFQDRYASRFTDMPGTVFTIKYKSSPTKKIIDESAGPPALIQLRVMMDSVVITRKVDNSWHKKTETPK